MIADKKNYIPPASGIEYELTNLPNGNIQLTDVTAYEQEGDTFGANDWNDLISSSISEYTCTGNTLTGSGSNGKFKADTENTYSTFLINGQSYNARQNGETSVDIINGAWYTFILDETDKTINFNSGAMVIPDGATIEPINDVKIWQKCAGLKPVYTSVQQILADTEVLTTLIHSSNAMDYFIRSTEIQSYILENEDAISILDSSLPYTTPAMSSDNTPEGSITSDGYEYNTYRAFDYTASQTTTNEAAYSGTGYVQYTLPYNYKLWFYRAQFKVVYSIGTSIIKLEGVTDTGSVVELSDEITVTPNTTQGDITKVILKPNSGGIVAVRIRALSGASYINNGRFWGK